MRVNSTIQIFDAAIERIAIAQQKALVKVAESLHTDVVQAQVIPRDTGNLQNEATFVDLTKLGDGKASLVHQTPYARRLYYHPEYDFHKTPWTDEKGQSHEGNPNAKGKWLEDYVSGGKKDFAKKEYKKFLKEEL